MEGLPPYGSRHGNKKQCDNNKNGGNTIDLRSRAYRHVYSRIYVRMTREAQVKTSMTSDVLKRNNEAEYRHRHPHCMITSVQAKLCVRF